MKFPKAAMLLVAIVPLQLGAAIFDSLDDASNFAAPLNAEYVVGSGEVSIVSLEPSVDRVADWMEGGTIPLSLAEEGRIEVESTLQILGGEWALWGVFFDGNESFLSEVEMLPFTDLVGNVDIYVPDFAPSEADSFVLRFRVREAEGDGFTFTRINATPIPEVRVLGMLFMAAGFFFRRWRRPE